MNGWLLDTNVISELRKPDCDEAVRRWSDNQAPESFFLSTVTVAEIRFGIERQPDPGFRNDLREWLESRLRPWFDNRILAVDEEVILEWRRLVERGKERRITFSQPNLFIAATARVHVLTVVTRNVADFEEADVPLLDPWTGIPSGHR